MMIVLVLKTSQLICAVFDVTITSYLLILSIKLTSKKLLFPPQGGGKSYIMHV